MAGGRVPLEGHVMTTPLLRFDVRVEFYDSADQLVAC